ncbi:MAG: WYL domain-containing protein [Candidatus Cryptobacteroides sp.]|nr:WYL domain-containing protein [Candidatus Cryptobacteroides sp.]
MRQPFIRPVRPRGLPFVISFVDTETKLFYSRELGFRANNSLLKRTTNKEFANLINFAAEYQNAHAMPANKNAVIRYMYLDQLLSDRYNKYTCEDLLKKVNERLELAGYPTIGGASSDYSRYIKSGKRVIQLDIQALQDSPFNMKIDSSEKRYGSPIYRYADQTQSLFNKPLSDDEKHLLQEVLNTLGQFSGLDSFEWLNDLKEKLNDKRAFGRSEYDKEMPKNRKIISFSSNDYLEGKDYLGTLFALISNKKIVDVEYEPFGEAPRIIRLYPYLLKQYNDRWYLIGTPLATPEFPYRKDFYVNLPLDRMKGVTAVDGLEYIDCEENFEDRYEDIIGITWLKEEELTEILIAVRNSFKGYIDTKPIHGSQTKVSAETQAELHDKYEDFEDYTFYTLNIKPNRELYNTLFSNGENIILLSPSRIRENMILELTSSLEKMKSARCEY